MPWIDKPGRPVYSTALGEAIAGDATEVLKHLRSSSVDLIVTSPPFALHKKKPYGNADLEEYAWWLYQFTYEFRRILKKQGSLVIEIPDGWSKGKPTKSLFLYEMVIQLSKAFYLAQDFYWYNPAKLPTPAEWVTIRRIRAKDAITPLWWFSKSPYPKADNRRVLLNYTKSMMQLMRLGYNSGRRPSGHVISTRWNRDNGGAIPPNLIVAANTESTTKFLSACRRKGYPIHPARFSESVPRFFIQMLTEHGDLVVDPFAGSNTVGWVAESIGRRWLAIDTDRDYLTASKLRFSVH